MPRIPTSREFCHDAFPIGRRSLAEALIDLLEHAVAREPRGEQERVLDRARVRAPVGDQAEAVHAEQRRAAVFGVVHAGLEALEPLAELRGELRLGGLLGLVEELA